MIIICHVVQSDKEKVADKFADLVLMDTLRSNYLGNLQDLRVSDLLYLFSWYQKCIHQSIKDFSLNQLVYTHCCKWLEH